MERKIVYNLEKSTNGYKFNDDTYKWEFKDKVPTVRILETANDLRYAGFGIQAIYDISLSFPDHSIHKTMKNSDEESLKKVEAWINKMLKKNKYKQVDFSKDLKETVMHNEYVINNIEKESA
jgi:hypothetical protein